MDAKMIGTIILGVIAIVIGVYMGGTVTTAIQTQISTGGSLTATATDFSAARAMATLVPVVYYASLLGLPLGFLYIWFKGRMGGM